MVDNELNRILGSYQVTVSGEHKNDKVYITTIKDVNKGVEPINIVYIDGVIYSVMYLNNEFFELKKDSELYDVVSSIMGGTYSVHTSVIRRRKSIMLPQNGTTNRVYPKRIYKDHGIKEYYRTLPKPFTGKQPAGGNQYKYNTRTGSV